MDLQSMNKQELQNLNYRAAKANNLIADIEYYISYYKSCIVEEQYKESQMCEDEKRINILKLSMVDIKNKPTIEQYEVRISRAELKSMAARHQVVLSHLLLALDVVPQYNPKYIFHVKDNKWLINK